MELRLGTLLIERGALTSADVDVILAEQQQTGEPFGALCERLFGIDPAVIESAWAEQYTALTRTVQLDSEPVEDKALELVTRRQAWQFGVFPIRFDGDELMMATTTEHLARALRFATNVIGVPVYLVIASAEDLGSALQRHYHLPGLDTNDLLRSPRDRLKVAMGA